MGYFEINKTILNTGKEDSQKIKALMNLEAQINMKQLIILRDMRIDIFGDNKTYDNSKK